MILGVRAVAQPLAFGNTVVLKASEVCPRTHGEIARALADAGLPPGVVNLITHEGPDAADVVDELISHPAVRRINFTGSTRVGRLVAENAARHLKRVLLELGGKAPQIVLPDADLDEAAAAAKFGAFMHQGQICMSTEKLVVDNSVADPFVAQARRARGRAEGGRPARPGDPDRADGRTRGSVERVAGLVDDAVAHGAEVVTGGEADGACYKPTVLTGVTPEMRIYSEESFGPVVCDRSAWTAPTRPCAWRTTPSTASPPSVFGRDVPTALDLARRIESGICHVNGGDRARRAADAVRRREGERLRALRRQGRARRVHRAALDHDPVGLAPLPDLARLLLEHPLGDGERGVRRRHAAVDRDCSSTSLISSAREPVAQRRADVHAPARRRGRARSARSA